MDREKLSSDNLLGRLQNFKSNEKEETETRDKSDCKSGGCLGCSTESVSVDSSDVSLHVHQPKLHTLDQILDDDVGSCGAFHLYIGLLVVVIQGSFATGVYASVFTDYTPNYHCKSNSSFLFNNSLFQAPDAMCHDEHGLPCTEWEYDRSVVESSASQEFDIVCDKALLKSWSGILRMSGILVGSFFFGWFSDTFGRVNSLALAGFILSFGQFVLAFSWDYLTFTILNVVCAGAGVGCFIVGFVYLFEWIATKYRTKVSVMAQTPFAVGYMYLVLLAYFIRNWRDLQLCVAAVNMILMTLKFVLPETARWLSIKGRNNDAMKSLRFAARLNKRSLSDDLDIVVPKENEVQEENVNIWTLVRKCFLLKRLLILSWNWVVVTMCFYGLSLSSARDENMYQNMAAMAAIEIPGYVISMLVIECWGRRPILGFFQVLGGISCISAGFIPVQYPTIKLALALVGKMGVSAGFAVVYVYTAELFPTKVRNSALGICSTMARFGGMVAPVIGDLESVYLPLPLLLMGVCSVSAGTVSFLLPETQGKPLPQTVEEAKFNS